MPKEKRPPLAFLIRKHLENPTREMHIAFSKLPLPHKWLLFSLLEAGEAMEIDAKRKTDTYSETLKARYEALCPDAEQRRFDVLLAELTEGFVTSTEALFGGRLIDWIHPSCRDLTIDELSAIPRFRQRFLKNCGMKGLQLAVSAGGGPRGDRFMPLLKNQRDWNQFQTRICKLQSSGVDAVPHLWASLESIFKTGTEPQKREAEKLRVSLMDAMPIYFTQNAARESWNISRLRTFLQLRKTLAPSTPFAGLIAFWNEITDSVEEYLHEDEAITESTSALREFTDAVKLIHEYEPIFLFNSQNSTSYLTTIDLIKERAAEEQRTIYFRDSSTEDSLETEQEAYQELHDVFWEIARLPYLSPTQKTAIENSARYFGSEASSLSRKMDRESSQKVSPAHIESAPEVRDISIEQLFEDL